MKLGDSIDRGFASCWDINNDATAVSHLLPFWTDREEISGCRIWSIRTSYCGQRLYFIIIPKTSCGRVQYSNYRFSDTVLPCHNSTNISESSFEIDYFKLTVLFSGQPLAIIWSFIINFSIALFNASFYGTFFLLLTRANNPQCYRSAWIICIL